MKATEVRNLSEAEIEQKVIALRKELYDLRCTSQAERVDQPHKMAVIKKDIARCLTILREKTGKNARQL